MKIIFLGFLFMVSACGFSPLYLSGSETVTRQTSAVEIKPIADYEGALLYGYLSDALNPEKMNIPKKYELVVVLNAPIVSEQNIQDDNFSSRERLITTAEYRLIDKKTRSVLIHTSASATGAYNIAVEPYATWMAEKKVQQNLIKMLAEQITMHLVSFVKKEAENEG